MPTPYLLQVLQGVAQTYRATNGMVETKAVVASAVAASHSSTHFLMVVTRFCLATPFAMVQHSTEQHQQRCAQWMDVIQLQFIAGEMRSVGLAGGDKDWQGEWQEVGAACWLDIGFGSVAC